MPGTLPWHHGEGPQPQQQARVTSQVDVMCKYLRRYHVQGIDDQLKPQSMVTRQSSWLLQVLLINWNPSRDHSPVIMTLTSIDDQLEPQLWLLTSRYNSYQHLWSTGTSAVITRQLPWLLPALTINWNPSRDYLPIIMTLTSIDDKLGTHPWLLASHHDFYQHWCSTRTKIV